MEETREAKSQGWLFNSYGRFYAPCTASGFVDRRTTACAMFLLTSERMARAEDMVVADEEDVCGSKAGRPADSIGRQVVTHNHKPVTLSRGGVTKGGALAKSPHAHRLMRLFYPAPLQSLGKFYNFPQ